MKPRDQVMKMQLEWLRKEHSGFSEQSSFYSSYRSTAITNLNNPIKHPGADSAYFEKLAAKPPFNTKTFTQHLEELLDAQNSDLEKIGACLKNIEEELVHVQQELTVFEKQMKEIGEEKFNGSGDDDNTWNRQKFAKAQKEKIEFNLACKKYAENCASKMILFKRYLATPEFIIATHINDAVEKTSEQLHTEISNELAQEQKSSTDSGTLGQLVWQTTELLYSLSSPKKDQEKNTKEKEQTIEKNLEALAKYEKLSSLIKKIKNYGTLRRISFLTGTVMEMPGEKEQKGFRDTTNFYFLEILALLDKIEPSRKKDPPKKGFLSSLFF